MEPPAFVGALPSAPLGAESDLADGTDYRDLFNRIDQGLCIIEMIFDEASRPIDYRFLNVNASFASQTGLENAVGRTMRELRPDHEAHWFEIYGKVALTGEAIRFDAPAAALDRWFDVYAFRVDAPHRRRVGILFRDMTLRKRDEEHRAVLARETKHRINNLLAVLASIVNLTDGASVEEYKRKLLGRIQALTNSQRFLKENHGEAASLTRLVEQELAAYRTQSDLRTSWRGAAVVLAPPQAQAMAMALHELATNATKYGALSTPAGRVDVDWSLSSDGLLRLRWTESDGPPVEPPARPGMGTGIIAAVVEGQLGGDVTFDWNREGLVCNVTMPSGEVGA